MLASILPSFRFKGEKKNYIDKEKKPWSVAKKKQGEIEKPCFSRVTKFFF